VRAEICQGLSHLGIELDPARNSLGAAVISAPGTRVLVRVMTTQETLMVARHTCDVLFGGSA
jgi:acetate kinase